MRYLNKPLQLLIQLGSKTNETRIMKTNGTLFADDIVATDYTLERFINFPHYKRNPDGSVNMDFAAVFADTQSFYLFAHKLIVSTLLMIKNYLPHSYVQQAQLPLGKFGKFFSYVYNKDNDLTKLIKKHMDAELKWAKYKIIDKRDNMVQHWTTNLQNQLMPTIQTFDLPILTYEHPEKFAESVDKKRILYWTEKIAKKNGIAYSSNENPGSNIAFLEAWYPKLSLDERESIDNLVNSDVYIALPISPIIAEELSKYLEKIFGIIDNVLSSKET